MRIVVTGLVASYPLGGVAWDYLAYVDGFRRLGFEVLYLEDTGSWVYDPAAQTFTSQVDKNIRFLTDGLRLIGAEEVLFSVRDPDGVHHGASAETVGAFCRSADLFLNVSGCCWLRDEYRGATRTAYLDSDPGYTQSKLVAVANGTADEHQLFSVNLIHAHDRFFTFAENFGASDCLIPGCGLDWKATRQPIVLSHWPHPNNAGGTNFTTVMSWKTDVSLPLIGGVRYGGKNVEFEKFIDLPARVKVPIEVAISGAAPLERLREHGWTIADAGAKSVTMESYREYLAGSRGEWSIAKNAYVGLRSGWFSCRTASYLALGKPAVVQDTGWSKYYPTGNGLFGFTSIDEAVAGLNAIESNYAHHCEAARSVAERELSSVTVLTRLLRDAEL